MNLLLCGVMAVQLDRREQLLAELAQSGREYGDAKIVWREVLQRRHRDILRFLNEGLAMETVAQAYGVSRQYVGEVYNKALRERG